MFSRRLAAGFAALLLAFGPLAAEAIPAPKAALAAAPVKPYSMGATQFLNTVVQRNAATLALGGGTITDSCKYLGAIWLRSSFSVAGNGTLNTMLNGNPGSINQTGVISESVQGPNFVFDNAGSTNGNVRINSGNSGGTLFQNGWGHYASATFPLRNSQWQLLVFSVDTCWAGTGAGRIAAAYVIPYGGTPYQVLDLVEAAATQFNINFSNAVGFIIGSNAGNAGPLTGEFGDYFWDWGHGYATSDGTHANIPAWVLAAFQTNGLPKDPGPNGGGYLGFQPTWMFKGSDFTTNLGYGGAVALTSPAVAKGGKLVPAANPPAGLAANRVGAKWRAFADNSTAGLSFNTNAYQNVSVPGDLIRVVCSVAWGGGTGSSGETWSASQTGWTTSLANTYTPGTADGAPITYVVFTRVLSPTDITNHPNNDWGFTVTNAGGATHDSTAWEMINFGQAVVDDIQSKANTTSSTNIASTSATATTPTDLEVFTGLDWGANEKPYTDPAGFNQRTIPQGIASGQTVIFTSDKQLSVSGTITGATGTKGTSGTSSSIHMLLKHN